MDGGDIAPAPAISSPSPGPGGHIPSRASSALAAVSVALGLLYLLWCFIWPYTKHVPRNGGIIGPAATSSSLPAPRPSCPLRTACVAGEAACCARETSPLPVFVHVTGAEKAECAVCLVEFGHGEAGRLVPGCGHGFHAECIEKWFRVNSTCPLCRGAAVVGAVADQRGAGGAPRL